jgi:ERCC4-related helicase
MDSTNSPVIEREFADSWIYPTNYAVREYQRAIVETCLKENTLVSLPTGLGKTLIAAVVMM